MVETALVVIRLRLLLREEATQLATHAGVQLAHCVRDHDLTFA